MPSIPTLFTLIIEVVKAEGNVSDASESIFRSVEVFSAFEALAVLVFLAVSDVSNARSFVLSRMEERFAMLAFSSQLKQTVLNHGSYFIFFAI